ncbi:hypothetical protein ACFLVN_03750 [Chloroflexota bacterium]
MSYLMRAVYNRTNWDRAQFPDWVAIDDLPSSIVSDLQADNNALSLWEIQDGEFNLSEVIVAIASRQPGSKAYFDYALLKTDLVDDISFHLSRADGDTPYLDANPYHRILSNLSMHKLVYFAHLLCKRGEFRRAPWKKVRKSILNTHRDGKLDVSRMRKGLKLELKIDEPKSTGQL